MYRLSLTRKLEKMKKNILSFTALCIIILSACAQQKKTTTNTKANKAEEIVYVRMERTACFGQCPTYQTEVFANGKVIYTGKMFTEYEGIYESTISEKDAANVFTELESKHVDTCSKEYYSMIADAPGLIYEIHYKDGRKQEIMNAQAGPEYLRGIAQMIDKTVKPDDKWKKTGDLNKQ